MDLEANSVDQAKSILVCAGVMSIRFGACGWASIACVISWCELGAAASSAPQAHVGLEATILDSTSLEGTAGVGGPKVVASSTEFGFPTGAAFSLGFMLSPNVNLGARIGFAAMSVTSGVKGSTEEKEGSTYYIDPYLAYLGGRHGDKARFTVGVNAGIGSSYAGEAEMQMTQYGAFIGVRAYPYDRVSVDPMLAVMRGSAKSGEGATEVEMTGTSIMLKLGFTLWLGGTASPKERTVTATGDLAARTALAPIAAPPLTTAPSNAAVAAVAPPAPAAPVASPTPVQSDRVTVPLGEGRALTLIAGVAGTAPDLLLVLRDSTPENSIDSCREVTLHAANQPESTLELAKGMAAISIGRIPILKGKVGLDTIKVFAVAPIANAAAASDHWLSVCGKRWLMSEADRANLKVFLEQQLVKAPPTPAPEPTAAPAAPPELAPAPAPASVPVTTQPSDVTRQPTPTQMK